MRTFIDCFESCVQLVKPTLADEANAPAYIAALEELADILVNTDETELKASPDISALDLNVKTCIMTDKKMVMSNLQEMADRVSLMSTLCTYESGRRDGMDGHNTMGLHIKYMQNVTALKKLIDKHYHVNAQPFCGTDC